MTNFRFIHTADIHLGSPLSGLALKDPHVAERFAAAGRDAFTALVDRALSMQVDFMVIAGDVYDGPWKDNHIGLFFNREIARLSRADIPVYFLRGNHDAESIVTRTIAMPDGVFEFSTRKPQTFTIDGLKVALHGQGFADRAASDNLAADYPPAISGFFNIGVLHTSLSGRPPHANYAPCTPEDLASRGYDYWALGHVHAFEQVLAEPLTIYPGNLQGRNIRETGDKGAVIVSVEDGRISYERLIVDCARFETVKVQVSEDMREADLLAAAETAVAGFAQAADERPIALRMTMSGMHPSARRFEASRRQWHDDVQAACQRIHADLWLEKLVLDLHTPAVEQTVQTNETLIDIAAMVDEVAGFPEFQQDAEALIADIARRLPGGLAADDEPLGDPVHALLNEARAVLKARLETESEG